MYEIISQHLANFISQNFNNFSILGRSAGGGLSMQMVFTWFKSCWIKPSISRVFF